jgi:predicted Fe-Mo cluster-binding NifX family protein
MKKREKGNLMLIAITSKGPQLTSEFDQHFGRAPYFVIVDSKSDKIVKSIDNTENLHAVQGAGVESGKVMIEEDVDLVLSNHVGTKALEVLQLGKISAYVVEAKDVKEALDHFHSNAVTPIYVAPKSGT